MRRVNEDMYALVFGESVLNDAVAVVLYRVFLRFVDEVSRNGPHLHVGGTVARRLGEALRKDAPLALSDVLGCLVRCSRRRCPRCSPPSGTLSASS